MDRPEKKAIMRQNNVDNPFERIAIYTAGKFLKMELNIYVIVVINYFSKSVKAYVLRNQEAVTVAEMLFKELISWFSVPLKLYCGQGQNFERTCTSICIR